MRQKIAALIALLYFMPAWLPTKPHLAANTPLAAPDEILRNATLVFRRVMDTPSAAIPAEVMRQARGVAVFPSARSDGEMYYGLGVVSAKGADPLRWSPPAIVNFRGALSINLDGVPIDLLLIAITRRGLNHLTLSQILPPRVRIEAGPLLDNDEAVPDGDLLAYAAFAEYIGGVPLDRSTVVDMKSMNSLLYRREYSTDDMVRGAGFFSPPAAARAWLDALADHSR